ncbi:hypothetical protein [Streptomyces rubiginosohelvolus]|uniref:hypothetical protein n=1 Tax=Streptomyces rubiginosohelvolus TaxID=67362 RepID=UPI00386E2D52|nr:hypothetical protein OG475_34550 [Streptomyces rubiginosohelvolus]
MARDRRAGGWEVAAVAASRSRGKGKTGGMLARRKAALERAALRMAEQRRAAEEAETERLAREAAFDELVADFELAVEDERAVAAEVEEELRRVRERGQVRVDAARVEAARVVLAMGREETVAGCAQRLGVGVERVKELRRLGRDALAEEEGAGSEGSVVPEARTAGGKQREGGRTAGSAVPEAEAVGGKQQGEGGRTAGSAVPEAGAAGAAPPVAAPPVAAPPVPAQAPAVPTPVGPQGPVGEGEARPGRPGWGESSR